MSSAISQQRDKQRDEQRMGSVTEFKPNVLQPLHHCEIRLFHLFLEPSADLTN